MRDDQMANLGKSADREDSTDGLGQLFCSYREALPDFDAKPNFMPELWKQIEARQSQTNFIGRISRALVTAALAASVLLGILTSINSASSISYFNGTYIEALTADHNAQADPFHPDRIPELEQQ